MTATRPERDWFYWFMSAYTALHLAWMVVLVYDFMSQPLAPEPILGSVWYRYFIVLMISPLALTVSILVLRRTPGNITGMCLLLWMVLNLGQAVPQSSPIFIYNGVFNSGWMGLWLLALYFPNGRAAPLRLEHWIRLLSVSTIILVGVWNFFQPTINNFNAVDPADVIIPNPFFIPALQPFQGLVNALEMFCLVSVIILIVPSLLLRYRVSNVKERAQIKWLAWTYGLLTVSLLFFIPSGLLSGNLYQYGTPGLVAFMTFGIYTALAPYISIGSAILRHRLYDIDIVIRRTLVYGALTALLALVYLGGVTVLQNLFQAISGQTSTAAIVISTLTIAALFNPLRNRIQELVDRRFYRQKYNAEQSLSDFAAAARSETDLQKLNASLVGTIQAALQPDHISIWMKPAPKHLSDQFRSAQP